MAVWYSDGAQKALTNGTYTVDAPQAEKQLIQSIYDGLTISKEPFVQKQKEKDMQFTIIKMARGGYLVRDTGGTNVAAFGEIDKVFAFLHNEFDPPLGKRLTPGQIGEGQAINGYKPDAERMERVGQAYRSEGTDQPGLVIGCDPDKKW